MLEYVAALREWERGLRQMPEQCRETAVDPRCRYVINHPGLCAPVQPTSKG